MRFALGVGALLLFYGVVAGIFVRGAHLNADEGFYLAAAHATTEGWMPYRDFTYTQGPFLPYVHGLVMNVIGFGMQQMRSLNAFYAGCSLLGIMLLLYRQGASAGVAVLCGIGLLASPAFFYFAVIGKTYAFAGMALLLSATALAFEGRPWVRFAWFALWAAASVGSRLTIAPAVLVLWIGLLARTNWRQSWPAAVAWPLGCAALLFVPSILVAPKSAFFWMWGLHAEYARHVSDRDMLAALMKSALFVPAVVGLALLAASLWRRVTLRDHGLWWLLAGVAGWLSNVGLSAVYGEYAAPFWPLTVAGSGALLARGPLGGWRVASAGAAVALALGIAMTSWGLDDDRPWLQSGYLTAIERSAAVVAAHSAPDDLVISSMPEVTLAAGRRIPPHLVAGKFSVTMEMSAEAANSLRLLTFQSLVDHVAGRAAAVVVLSAAQRWSFGWTVPSLRLFLPADYARFTTPLEKNYRRAYADEFFEVWALRPVDESVVMSHGREAGRP